MPRALRFGDPNLNGSQLLRLHADLKGGGQNWSYTQQKSLLQFDTWHVVTFGINPQISIVRESILVTRFWRLDGIPPLADPQHDDFSNDLFFFIFNEAFCDA